MTFDTAEPNEAGEQKTKQRDAVTPNSLPPEWMAPVSEAAPCGPDLEYDHDFVVLFASAASRQDVQYGSFVGAAEPINWAEVERDCRRLLVRTKDIRVALLHTRCRTRLAGAKGLAESLGRLSAWLHAYPEQLHPCESADYTRSEALEMRMNALQGLVDPEGLMSDVREIVLARSTVARLQVRDVERAFACPRPADALAPESVTQQLHDLRRQQPETMKAFDEALMHLAAIDTWCAEHLDDMRPNLDVLMTSLEALRSPEVVSADAPIDVEPVEADVPTETAESGVSTTPEAMDAPEVASADEIATPMTIAAPSVPRVAPNDRQSALASIRAARAWFETHEPSSPIPVLLKRAEQFVGKRYADVVKAIPPELLAEWEG